MKILIVDKNKEFRNYFGRVFCGRGDEARVLDSIDACVTACVEFSPDWILISISEQTNGMRKIGEIIAELPAARIGIIADYDDVRLRRKAAEIGAAAFFSKEHVEEICGVLKTPPVEIDHHIMY